MTEAKSIDVVAILRETLATLESLKQAEADGLTDAGTRAAYAVAKSQLERCVVALGAAMGIP